jgi:hypothetical protein
MLNRYVAALGAAIVMAAQAAAQTTAEPKRDEPKPASAPAAASDGPLVPLAWLEGCWRGSVNKREFREHWLPLRGDLLVGASHTVVDGKTQDFEYLRIEPRADGVWYVAAQPGKPEAAFKLSGTEIDKESGDTTFAFDAGAGGFPQHIRYRRGSEGWLYAQVDGVVNGAERTVIYPMRRIDCESGEPVRK